MFIKDACGITIRRGERAAELGEAGSKAIQRGQIASPRPHSWLTAMQKVGQAPSLLFEPFGPTKDDREIR